MSRAKGRKPKKPHGQRVIAGRRFLGRAHAHTLSPGHLAHAFLSKAALAAFLACIAGGLAASTLQIPFPSFDRGGEPERATLFNVVAGGADRVRDLDGKALGLLFGEPTLLRTEAGVQVWQYKTDQCALDIYFKGGARLPVYAEYRLKGERSEAGRLLCVRSLYERARAF